MMDELSYPSCMVGNGGKENFSEWCQFLTDDDILSMINNKNSLSGELNVWKTESNVKPKGPQEMKEVLGRYYR